jgi:hypothetical protein
MNIKEKCEQTKRDLKLVQIDLENCLNECNLNSFDSSNEEDIFYNKGLLSDLRHLIVSVENHYEKIASILRNPKFNETKAENFLYEIYHDCINKFFYPQNESYSEDGRYAYTNRDAIRFRKKFNAEVKRMIVKISKVFEKMREYLSYYEINYKIKK